MNHTLLPKFSRFHIAIALFIAITLTQCGGMGGTEVGNPPTITSALTGEVSSTSSSLTLVKSLTSTVPCEADEIILTDSNSEAISSSINSDCTFEIEVEANKAYTINLLKNDEFIASLIFNYGSSRNQNRSFYFGDNISSFHLGLISISGAVGRPEFEPSEFFDRDSDGIFDFEDEDDDDDGLQDDYEDDCDLDGFWNDDDEIEDNCDSSSSDSTEFEDGFPRSPQVIGAYPVRDDDHVDIDTDIEILFNCPLDEETIGTDKIFILDENSNSIACEFELHEHDRLLSCTPEGLSYQTTYTVIVTDVACSNGSPVRDTEWTFETAENDSEEED